MVVTDAEMSKRWEEVREIEVKGSKYIGEALRSVGYGNGIMNYISGGTCIGARDSIEGYLKE